MKPRVFIATPVYRFDRESVVKTSSELAALLELDAKVSVLDGYPWVDIARTVLVHEFLRSDSEWLFFRDQDVTFAAELMSRMLKLELPMVVAPYARRIGDGFDVHFVAGMVESAGLGCALIHREVLERIWAEYREDLSFDYDGVSLVHIFDRLFVQRDNGRQIWREDRAFCWRVRQAGIPIRAIAPAQVAHAGKVTTYRGESNG